MMFETEEDSTRHVLVLASGSAVRATLLREAGLRFSVDAPAVDEGSIKEEGLNKGQQVSEVALTLARAKASTGVCSHPEAYVIAADQMLEFDGRWLDKPRTVEEAGERLREFSGRSHRLVTATVLQRGPAELLAHVAYATLAVRPLSDQFIAEYLNKTGEEVCRSVGGYQLEGLGAHLFERVEGDFFTILGMALLPLLAKLREQRVLFA